MLKKLRRLNRWDEATATRVMTLWYCGGDPRAGPLARWLSRAAVLYVYSPIDLIPDFIPFVGHLDDLLLVPAATRLVQRWVPEPVWQDASERVDNSSWDYGQAKEYSHCALGIFHRSPDSPGGRFVRALGAVSGAGSQGVNLQRWPGYWGHLNVALTTQAVGSPIRFPIYPAMDPLSNLFIFRVHPAELFLRATLMYWALFLTFRFVVRRDAGSLGLADLVFVVIVADAAQNALAGEYKTIAEGVMVVGVLVSWKVVLDWAGFHFPLVEKLLQPPPLRLVVHGRPVHRNLRKEHIALSELDAQLRQSGVEDISLVREAFLESDGRVSVPLYEKAPAAKAH